MNERTAHAAMDEAAEWAAKQDARMRKAYAARDEAAEWESKNVIAMRRAMHVKRNDLQRYVIEGPYKRERKNPRLGLLICCVGALTVIGLIGWAMS